MAFTTTTTVSVSSKKPMDCVKMAKFLGAQGFYTSVAVNTSAEPDIEYGCRLTQSMTEKKEVESLWTTLKDEYDLECAHIRIGDQFDGCILDFLRPSLCPSNIKSNNKLSNVAFSALAPQILYKMWGKKQDENK